MGSDGEVRVIEFDSLELPMRIPTRLESFERRRLMTLFAADADASPARLRGGTAFVVKARNALGETFALKRPRTGDGNRAQVYAAFRQEYDMHRLAAQAGCVPKLFGFAEREGEPAILMEWVHGESLQDVLVRLGEPLAPRCIADIGIAGVRALCRIQKLDKGLVHRDISLANIVVRTHERSVEEQLDKGIVDVCLLDFGSATDRQCASSSFTATEDLWRGGTAAFAAPEMLGRDDAKFYSLRKDPAVDVFALCSVLFTLYAGMAPWPVRENPSIPPYHVKTTEPPRTLEARGEDDGSLAELIQSGLALEQGERPGADQLLEALLSWEDSRGMRHWRDYAARHPEPASEPECRPAATVTRLRVDAANVRNARSAGAAAEDGQKSARRKRVRENAVAAIAGALAGAAATAAALGFRKK